MSDMSDQIALHGPTPPQPKGTILYLVDGLGLSGKTKGLVDLITHLDPRRYQVVVYSFVEENGILADRLRANRTPLYTVSCRDGLCFKVVLRLVRIMHRLRPDVVHCYNPRPILYGGLAARFAGIRGTIGSLSAFSCQVPDRNYTFLPQPLHTISRRNVYRNRLAARLMRHLITVSPSLGDRFCRYNKVPRSKLRVISYGVDLEAAWQHTSAEVASSRRQLGFGANHVVIGSIGRLVEQKDYVTQLTAFARAAKQTTELRMILVGEGPLYEPLRRLAQDLGVQDKVRFIGPCESQRVPLVMRSLDIFVLSSKFEPFGVVLLEAKAAALAIAATAVNEVPEIVIDGQSGLLAPPEDPERLAELFVKLAKDPHLRQQLGQEALREAKDRHSLQAVTRRYQELYDEVRV